MARKVTTTVRLDREDAEALARARKDGLAASDLIRKGLRLVAARYYRDRRSPSIGLFVSTDAKLGDEEEIFRNLER
jgi:Arc/MetJ-type ribon-helix-helix transcriptional regulator